jgi:Cu-Zn family superoxide dismutase
MKSKTLLALSMVLAAFSFSNAYADHMKPIKSDIVGADGKKIGDLMLRQLKDGVEVKVHVMGLKPGLHGLHIHANGKCEAPDFKSAGGHFAAPGQHHGMKNPQGPHWGDLPNLNVEASGMGMARFLLKTVTLKAGDNSLMKTGGTSLVIHATADDMMTDPSGNSGDRIACAVISQ